MMDRDEYCRIRDETALERYRELWPQLKAREKELRAEIAHLEATERKKVIDDAKREKDGPYFQLQYVTAMLSEIEKDAPRRLAQLKLCDSSAVQ